MSRSLNQGVRHAKSRTCGHCNGRGFVFESITLPGNKTFFGVPVLEDKGIKVPCGKCFGKGMK